MIVDITFVPNEVIEPVNCVLTVLSAEANDAYGPQIAVKVKIIAGDHEGHTFIDYLNRDEDTGAVKQGSKAWSLFEACLGPDFYKRGLGLRDLVGRRFRARVTQTKTGSRNKLEHGTIGPAPSSKDDDGLDDLPF
jgi:hypothetical protein